MIFRKSDGYSSKAPAQISSNVSSDIEANTDRKAKVRALLKALSALLAVVWPILPLQSGALDSIASPLYETVCCAFPKPILHTPAFAAHQRDYP